MARLVSLALVLAVGSAAWSRSAAADDAVVAPRTAQAVGVGVTVAGLAASAYLWHRASARPEDDGRFEGQLTAAGAAALAIGVGPMTGLALGGAPRRALYGALGRPAALAVATGGVVVGALVVGFGCGDTGDCTAAEVTGGVLIGAGAALGVAAVAWAAVDLWQAGAGRARVAPVVGVDRVGLVVSVTR